MTNYIFIFIALIWYVFGVWSFLYWWYKQFDRINPSDWIFSLVAGFLGPITYYLGKAEYDNWKVAKEEWRLLSEELEAKLNKLK